MSDLRSKTLDLDGQTIAFKPMHAGDEAAVLAFARALAPHELLFLPRDIREPKVVRAWFREMEAGHLATILAWQGQTVVGCATVARDPHAWSSHVAEIRALVSPAARGLGLGQRLIEEAFQLAVAGGAVKICAQMTTDQKSAIAVFEGLGFRPEAILRDHVREAPGIMHDLLVLSHNVAEVAARAEAYGLSTLSRD